MLNIFSLSVVENKKSKDLKNDAPSYQFGSFEQKANVNRYLPSVNRKHIIDIILKDVATNKYSFSKDLIS